MIRLMRILCITERLIAAACFFTGIWICLTTPLECMTSRDWLWLVIFAVTAALLWIHSFSHLEVSEPEGSEQDGTLALSPTKEERP